MLKDGKSLSPSFHIYLHYRSEFWGLFFIKLLQRIFFFFFMFPGFQKISSTTTLNNIDNKKYIFIEHQISIFHLISEGSCDTDDLSNDC